jgi:hypothetical protein
VRLAGAFRLRQVVNGINGECVDWSIHLRKSDVFGLKLCPIFIPDDSQPRAAKLQGSQSLYSSGPGRVDLMYGRGNWLINNIISCLIGIAHVF